AILLPVFIEFSRCIGTYSSAKFEYINIPGHVDNSMCPFVLWISIFAGFLQTKIGKMKKIAGFYRK
ncbi:hypothetical protein, partial [Parablautia muri]